jgi:acetyl-CoA/propionyl-CoA carboxylase biotin carboxyl carrier protein
VAYAAYALLRLRDLWPPGPIVDPWDVPSGWRLDRPRPLAFTLSDEAGSPLVVTITGTPERAVVQIGSGDPLTVSLQSLPDGGVVSVGRTSRRVWAAVEGSTHWILVDGDAWALRELGVARRSVAGAASERDVRSPMPGTVLQIRAVHGALVHAGQPLVVIEAMKMEHVLVAADEGTVDIMVAEGDLVDADQLIARIELIVPLVATPAGVDADDEDVDP